MQYGSRWLRKAVIWTSVVVAAAAQSALAAPPHEISSGTADASQLVDWVVRSDDHRGRPFAVVDKRAAHLWVFAANGRLAGETPVLLGQAKGDAIAPGVGEHAQQGRVPFNERTTPAGRFEAQPGRNNHGEPIVWVDYASAFAIHRVRPGRTWKMRVDSLGSTSPEGKRQSWGCVVVPVAFYERVVAPVLGNSPSVVYVLPESRPAASLLNQLAQQ